MDTHSSPWLRERRSHCSSQAFGTTSKRVEKQLWCAHILQTFAKVRRGVLSFKRRSQRLRDNTVARWAAPVGSIRGLRSAD